MVPLTRRKGGGAKKKELAKGLARKRAMLPLGMSITVSHLRSSSPSLVRMCARTSTVPPTRYWWSIPTTSTCDCGGGDWHVLPASPCLPSSSRLEALAVVRGSAVASEPLTCHTALQCSRNNLLEACTSFSFCSTIFWWRARSRCASATRR